MFNKYNFTTNNRYQHQLKHIYTNRQKHVETPILGFIKKNCPLSGSLPILELMVPTKQVQFAYCHELRIQNNLSNTDKCRDSILTSSSKIARYLVPCTF